MKALMIFYDETGTDILASASARSLASEGIGCEVVKTARPCDVVNKFKCGGAAIVFQADVAARLAALKKKRAPELELIMVCRDYGCARGTASIGADRYIIPHECLRFSFVNKNVEDAKILSFGLPVDLPGAEPDREEARAEIGLDRHKGVVLYLCDGAAFGEAAEAVTVLAALCGESWNHVILCKNGADAERYSLKFANVRSVYAESQFDCGRYMDACDVVFCAPDAVFLTLAAARRIPVILFSARGAGERMNADFFVGRGMAFAGKTARDKASYASRLCTTARFRDNITDAQKKYITQNGAENLAKYLSEKQTFFTKSK